MTDATTEKSRTTKERVLRAYSGIATPSQAKEKLQGVIGDSSHEKYRAELVREGKLGDIDSKKKGPGEHRFIPMDELPLNKRTGRTVIESDSSDSSPKESEYYSVTFPLSESERNKKGSRLPRDHFLAIQMATEVMDRSTKILSLVARNEAWKKRSRIVSICEDRINPLLEFIENFRNATEYQITSPDQYFEKEPPRIDWQGSFGRKVNLQGTIPLPYPGTKMELHGSIPFIIIPHDCPTQDGFLRPTLIDWTVYLTDLIEEIGIQLKELGSDERKNAQIVDYKRLYLISLEENQALRIFKDKMLPNLRKEKS